MRNIRAITFDLDDTLWDNRPVLMAAEQELYNWLISNYPRIGEHHTLESMRGLRKELYQNNPELRHDISELRRVSLRRAAEAAGYDPTLAEPAFAVFLEARHRIELFDDVIPGLQRFRDAGYRLGSLTNGNADVRRLGIAGLFDFSLTAETVGRAKPDPRMFREACRRARVAPEQLVHVGDEADTDLAGGQAAGITVIWMNRNAQSGDPGVTPHAEVRDMQELLALFGLD